MASDRPERPGVAAVVTELNVERHARIALPIAVAFSALVFLFFAYLPGTDEPLSYWLGLTVVLAFSVFVLLVVALSLRTAYRRVTEETDEAGGRSPTTIALLVGILGWIAVPLVAGLSPAAASPEQHLPVAVLGASFAALAVGALGTKIVVATSVDHDWRPWPAAVGAVVYTVLVAIPSIGGPVPRLGTPDGLVATIAGGTAAADPVYLATVGGGGLLVGAWLSLQDAPPSHGFVAGTVAAISVLPIVAAATGDPTAVRTSGFYLPVILGTVGAVGGAIVAVGRRVRDRPDE